MKLKTKKEVLSDYPNYKSLINSVLSEIDNDLDTVHDIIINGIDAGYGGFVYYDDTHKFAMKHRTKIIDLLEETADQMGLDGVVELVSNFATFRSDGMDKDERKDLYKYLGGSKVSQGTITNLMCWFAVEEVCRWFED
jgi:hypothetical protein